MEEWLIAALRMIFFDTRQIIDSFEKLPKVEQIGIHSDPKP